MCEWISTLVDGALSWRLLDKPRWSLDLAGGTHYTNLYERLTLQADTVAIDQASTQFVDNIAAALRNRLNDDISNSDFIARLKNRIRSDITNRIDNSLGGEQRRPSIPIAPLGGRIREEVAQRVEHFIQERETALRARIDALKLKGEARRAAAWEKLTPEQQKLSARRMEIYAAMVANMDFHIGRVLDHLKSNGQLDDTLVVFMSDNGPEPTELAKLVELVFDEKAKKWFLANFDTRPENWGRKGSTVDYGPAWAQVGSTPFRFYKAWTAEGGIHSPVIIAGPGVKEGVISPAVVHVTDLVPTFLEIAGARHPSATEKNLSPLLGKSLVPLLAGKSEAVRTDKDWIGEELFGNRAVRQGDWKLCYILKGAGGTGEWELFNINTDPGETPDLSKQEPAKRKELLALWDDYVKQNGVLLTNHGPFKLKTPAAED
jgi:arylsulfatase A-like enzyme